MYYRAMLLISALSNISRLIFRIWTGKTFGNNIIPKNYVITYVITAVAITFRPFSDVVVNIWHFDHLFWNYWAFTLPDGCLWGHLPIYLMLSATRGTGTTASDYRIMLSATSGTGTTASDYRFMLSATSGTGTSASDYRLMLSATSGTGTAASDYPCGI